MNIQPYGTEVLSPDYTMNIEVPSYHCGSLERGEGKWVAETVVSDTLQ